MSSIPTLSARNSPPVPTFEEPWIGLSERALNHAGLIAIVTGVSREGHKAPPTCVRARWHAL